MNIADARVLVTGADGFIGSHLTELLAARGARVRALSYYNSFNSWGWLEDIEGRDRIEIVAGDVRDARVCRTITKDIDVVFHLAALIAIPYSYSAPESYVETNVRGTLNMLEAAREHRCSRFLQTSTSEVYGTALTVPIDESHPLQPQSPYSASKSGADALALSYWYAFNLPVVVARPFNTYGPRQSARAVIPTIITQLASGKTKVRLGDTTPTRDLTFVKDTAAGLVALASCDGALGEVVNIGSNFEISIGQVFDLIAQIFGVKAEVERDDARLRPERSEVRRLWCNNAKMRRLSGFEPAFDIRKGLAATVEWFRTSGRLPQYKAHLYNV